MSLCAQCDDKGIIRLRYHSGDPDEFGVCVCPAGRWFRTDQNAGRGTGYFGWAVWGALNNVNPERIAVIEELLDDDEMAGAFPWWTADEDAPGADQVDQIAQAMRTAPRPKL